jgi:hypothetical protein
MIAPPIISAGQHVPSRVKVRAGGAVAGVGSRVLAPLAVVAVAGLRVQTVDGVGDSAVGVVVGDLGGVVGLGDLHFLPGRVEPCRKISDLIDIGSGNPKLSQNLTGLDRSRSPSTPSVS